jgi:hypothetical protein
MEQNERHLVAGEKYINKVRIATTSQRNGPCLSCGCRRQRLDVLVARAPERNRKAPRVSTFPS